MNIIIVDDDKIVETSLKTILEVSGDIFVLGTGNNGQEAVELYDKLQPDVALLDIQMPIMTGIEAATEILRRHPNAKILFLTTFFDNDYIQQAIRIGAKGYILKQDFANIALSLNAVMSGQMVFGVNIGEVLTSAVPDEKSLCEQRKQIYKNHDITGKEAEVIALIADGMNNKEISQKLFLSEGTVRNYLSQILEKMHLRDRTQLAIFYHTGVVAGM